MYIIKVENSFNSAHFLAGYKGKCANIHGHRWKVEVEVQTQSLEENGQIKGMVADFSDVKSDLNDILENYDHALIIEYGSMRSETLNCIIEDGFKVVQVPFRTTAENFARFFYKEMKKKGYDLKRVTVHETLKNSATYEE